MLKITVLGTGASGGIPIIGCDCGVCKSSNPKNKRSRVSILLESATTKILVDTSPDLREQALQNNITAIDAIIYTHSHADHLHGIDDVRSFNYQKNAAIDAYGDSATLAEIRERFAYTLMLANEYHNGWYRPCLNPLEITAGKAFKVGDIEILPFEQIHGRGKSLGFRFGNFAYSTDVNVMPEQAFESLEGIDIWLVDCLRYLPAPSHSHLERTLQWIERVKPKQAYLTHMHHEFDYDILAKELPSGVFPAYDGLVIEC